MRIGDVIPTRGSALDLRVNLIEPFFDLMVAPRSAARSALMNERLVPVFSRAMCFCPLRRTGTRVDDVFAGLVRSDDETPFEFRGLAVTRLMAGLTLAALVIFGHLLVWCVATT